MINQPVELPAGCLPVPGRGEGGGGQLQLLQQAGQRGIQVTSASAQRRLQRSVEIEKLQSIATLTHQSVALPLQKVDRLDGQPLVVVVSQLLLAVGQGCGHQAGHLADSVYWYCRVRSLPPAGSVAALGWQ